MTDRPDSPPPLPGPSLPPPDAVTEPSVAPERTDRRTFLRLGGITLLTGAAAVAGVRGFDALRSGDGGAAAPGATPRSAAGPGGARRVDDLILVTIQLTGGLDHLASVVPTSGRVHDLRRAGAVVDSELLRLDDEFSLHASMPQLARSWEQGRLAIVHGVGVPEPTLSHFVETAVWERGSPRADEATGWLGRALASLDGELDPLLGVSVGGSTPSMVADGWSGVAIPDDGRLPWSNEFVDAHPGIVAAYQAMLTQPAGAAPGIPLGERVRGSQRIVREVADTLGGATDLERAAAAAELFGDEDEEGADAAPGGGLLGVRLGIVADLITSRVSTRAFHVVHGDFDTHAGQTEALPARLAELDAAIAGFWQQLGPAADRVVVATWTEFGRRPEWNGEGTEHGTAGVQLVTGPAVRGGHHGEPPPLDRFDRDGNFLVTVDFRDYLGALATDVLGVDGQTVLPGAERTLRVVGP